MGITGLLPFVKNSCRPANIKDFSGSTVAIDAYSWLHKGAFSCAEKLVKGEKTDGYVFYCMKQLNLLLEAGLRPIMVFDGCNLCSKEVTEKKRKENREKTRQRGKELLCEGKLKEARECFQRCVDVTPEMAREVIEACRKKSIDCIVAPYEADAQLAYLDKIGMAQLIITEDSDLILFGCNRVLFKMDSCGGGFLFEKENLSKSFGSKALKFSFEKFRYMCILSGCDYLPSLPGIGLAKACKFFTLTNNTDLSNVLSKVPSYLKMPTLTVPNEYIESFIKANNTFLYQLVFCPQKKCLVPLNPYPEDLKPADMEYAGKYLPEDLACQLAMGDINVKTLKEFDVSWSDPPSINEEKSVVWGSQGGLSSSKPSAKVELTAFKFSTPKQKAPSSQKRQFAEMVNSTGEAACTDEELFSMYGGNLKRSHSDCNSYEEESIIPTSEISLCDSPLSKESKSIGNSPQNTHPKILNLPFRKIVRSRFFSTEITPNKDLNSESPISSSPELVESKSDVSISSDMGSASPTKAPELINSTSAVDHCEFTIELNNPSPKIDNKENIVHRFAKKKISDVKHSLPIAEGLDNDCSTDKLKNDSWLDIIDDECKAATSTVSSSGKASKLIDIKKFEFTKPATINNVSKRLSKKLTVTKINYFKWKKEFTSKTEFNTSLGSDGDSCNESFEAITETNEDIADCPSTSSPFFQPPTILNNQDAVINISSDSEETDVLDNISTSQDHFVNISNTSFSKSNSSVKALKPLNLKNCKPGRCRTLGLSKNRKGCDKVSRKETLLNFNFIRQPKKEIPVVS